MILMLDNLLQCDNIFQFQQTRLEPKVVDELIFAWPVFDLFLFEVRQSLISVQQVRIDVCPLTHLQYFVRCLTVEFLPLFTLRLKSPIEVVLTLPFSFVDQNVHIRHR